MSYILFEYDITNLKVKQKDIKDFEIFKGVLSRKHVEYFKNNKKYKRDFYNNIIYVPIDFDWFVKSKISKTKLISKGRRAIKPWVSESYSLANNKSIISGDTENLVVHHVISYMELFEDLTKSYLNCKDIFSNSNFYIVEDIDEFKEKLLKAHYDNGYGAVITEKEHKEFHKQYGKKGTKEDFERFYKYCTGKDFIQK